jgi:hypothetical protein
MTLPCGLADLQCIEAHFSILTDVLVKRRGGYCGVDITRTERRGNREDDYQDLLGHRCKPSEVSETDKCLPGEIAKNEAALARRI